MRKLAYLLGAAVLVAGTASSENGVIPVPDDLADTTYSKHISRLVQAKCGECHRPEGIAPFSLNSYRQVKGWSKMIQEVVHERRMPPWGLEPGVGKWANDPSLTEKEMAMLDAWVENGFARGDASDLPEPVEYVDDWTIGEPDIVLEMPEEVTIPATGVVDYAYYQTETNFEEDMYFSALEVLPGNRKVVHHIIIFVIDPNSARDEKAAFTTPMLDVYAPGSPAGALPKGQVRMIPKGARIMWQVHYTPTGKEETDRSKFGLIIAKDKPEEIIETATIVNDDFKIPPHHPNYKVEASMPFPAPATIYSFTPHMHYRGKSMDFVLEYPDGREELACSIPAYDFNWQLDYRLAEPLKVPAGTVVKVVGHFDNSEDNPYNPDPTKSVTWGEQTWEEMLMGGIFMSWDNNPRETDD